MGKKVNFVLIQSGRSTVKVKSYNGLLLKRIVRHPFMCQYIPSVEIIKENDSKIDCEIAIKLSKKFRVELTYPKINCFQPRRADVRGLISLIGYALERANNERRVYSIHSSVVVKNGKAVIIFGGATNLGKTTIAKTISDKFGWKFYSDESALIDGSKNTVIGSVKMVANYGKFKPFKLVDAGNNFKIVSFIYPHIDNGLSQITRWNHSKFFWHLKEELSRKIRGGSKAIDFFDYPLQSLDTQKISKNRLEFAKEVSNKINCFEMRGRPNIIAKAINELNK